MTFREKLQQEYPECINETLVGGCIGCPYDYLYENARACDRHALCEMCWDREMSDNEQTPKFGDWISVKERLPELNKLVLTCRRKVLIKLELRTELNFTYDSLYEPVEFWMPLPEAPEVGE